MCGIFGFSLRKKDINKRKALEKDISILYKLSETRGVEAAGFAMQVDHGINIFKKAIPAFQMSKSAEYKEYFNNSIDLIKQNILFNFIAHSRLATNGIQADNKNNQPVHSKNLVCVHNGIVTNTNNILKKFSNINVESKLDTEVLIQLIDTFYQEDSNLIESIKLSFNEIEGNANVALLDDNNRLLLATDNGSIYYIKNESGFVFASEIYILKQYINKSELGIFNHAEIKHLESGDGVVISNDEFIEFKLKEKITKKDQKIKKKEIFEINDHFTHIQTKRKNIKRCSKCILPKTMPFIKFDKNGECNYCKSYKKQNLLGKEKLKERLSSFTNNGKTELIFAFSGGRDSCYALHYMVKELGIKPIAYSYDWGMITDLGRRNQARLLGKLGVEHVIVSADLRAKRNNVHKNVEAWLKNPDLGMIPLIIAGDKQMFFYAQQVQKHYNAKAFMFSVNYLEKTDFKTGFANVNTVDLEGLSMSLTKKNKYAMIFHYLKNFMTNPSYINSSLIDTFDAFTKYYNKKANERIEFFDYIEWDEETVNNTLLNEYNWETSPDTTTTWRIGDGTAAFYNYIYYTVAGFTENDTFRSNQIREGVLSREKAFELVEVENKPRWETIKEYCELIQVDFVKAIEVIDNIPKLYLKKDLS
ncbi:MAG TPA: hypothetical protein EYG73_00820 [Arcobacter sp.]|nr:hypothetical protein [Arcobacter sp.]